MPGVQSKGLRLLSFDGGGARALSQIKIMESLIHRIQFDTYPDDPDKIVLPCECVDLIGGSDTGGVLAIMFGKLCMPVKEVYEEFNKIRREVYARRLSAQERTDKLKECIEDLLVRRGHPIDMKLRGTERCLCFVVATPKANMQSKTKLRSYITRSDPPSDVTVVEAVLATCATLPFFLPVAIGKDLNQQELVGGALGLSNPCYELIVEGRARFKPTDSVCTILSIGSGHLGVLSLSDSEEAEQLAEIFRNMTMNCEKTAQDMADRLNKTSIYFRFSVNQGLQQHHEASVQDPVWLNTQTQAYLESEETSERLDICVETILLRECTINLRKLGAKPGSEVGKSAESVASQEREQDMKMLESLSPPSIKHYSLPDECMDGTRQDILERIDRWINDVEAPNILWINGYPGVGKSALASTVVSRLRQRSQLGSSFFFRRADADISTANALWRSISFDFALQYTSVRKRLIATLEADRNILTTANIEELFQHIIFEPLDSSNEISSTTSLVVVIDALDECGGLEGQYSQNRKKVLRTLAKWPNLPSRFKIIVTSRREYDIERVMQPISRVIEIHAGTKVSQQSSADIKAFLISRFKLIAEDYSSLASDWPGSEAIDRLTRRAGGLFIWARIVGEFISRGEPNDQLICIQQGQSNGNDMPSLYTQVITISFPDPRPSVIEAFRAIMGAIVFLKRPLSPTSISRLLSIDETRMQHICNNLKPVVEMGSVLQITHQSFTDYLLDSDSCLTSFYIKQEEEEPRLALACMKTMRNGLKFNICGIMSSYSLNADIGDLENRIQHAIPDPLYYSSRYWVDHLAICQASLEMIDHLNYFMENQFLFWLEVLSVTKHMNVVCHLLLMLIEWMKSHSQNDLMAIDFQRFVKSFTSVIAQSMPHIYISALPFAPRTSVISNLYKHLYPHSLRADSGDLERWPVCQNVIYVGKSPVTQIAFSPDGRLVISGDDDNIKVYDSETGEIAARPIEAHGPVISLLCSSDGKRIYWGSIDGNVRIWDSEAQNLMPMVSYHQEEPTNKVIKLRFSPAGRLFASISDSAVIRVYHLDTGEAAVGPFEMHDTYRGYSVVFSPDERRLACKKCTNR